MAQAAAGRFLLAMIAAGALTACAGGEGPFASRAASGAGEEDTAAAAGSTRLIERDVEAPEVFQVAAQGLWDGRPSLGGVWVAHSDVVDPERVIIRNESNGKFVIGALFRRERENPGPRLQVSSDAAAALGMLAGAPAELNVTALKREEVPVTDPAPAAEPTAEGAAAPAPGEIETAALDPVVAGAAAALDKAGGGTPAPAADASPAPVAPVAGVAPVPPEPQVSAAGTAPGTSGGFLQVGIFSVEENADNTIVALKQAGIAGEIRRSELKGKPYWRVLAGPAGDAAERSRLLAKVKALGFTDAYAVSG